MSSKKSSPIRAIFEGLPLLTKDDIIESELFVNLIKSSAYNSIKEALKANSQVATLFEINDSACYVEIRKSDWINALESCIVLYIEEEDYDTCSKISDLIKQIKQKQTKKVD